jgi:hypothetical protein
MAGGIHARVVPCMVCLGDDLLVKALRTYEGVEDDHYLCVRGHDFGVDWRRGPATEPQWPPDPALFAALGPPIER